MAGVREIRRRIRSVSNMQQITKAMKMVAAAKLRRAQEKVVASRPYGSQIQSVMARIIKAQMGEGHPLLTKRPVRKVGYVLMTSDSGLCGGYNANLIRTTRGILEEKRETGMGLITVGRKGTEYFSRRKVEIITRVTGLGDAPRVSHARRIAREMLNLYTAGELDEVYLVYSKFVSVLSQVPTVQKILPFETSEEKISGDYLFEPAPERFLNQLIPSYVESQVFSALLEGKASEQGARMTAMDSATENAKEMIGKLTLVMNRARQAAITKEISEIVGGAAALE